MNKNEGTCELRCFSGDKSENKRSTKQKSVVWYFKMILKGKVNWGLLWYKIIGLFIFSTVVNLWQYCACFLKHNESSSNSLSFAVFLSINWCSGHNWFECFLLAPLMLNYSLIFYLFSYFSNLTSSHLNLLGVSQLLKVSVGCLY